MATSVVFNRFGAIARSLRPACRDATKVVAKDMTTTCQSFAPRDTGFMAESVYFSAYDESSYGSAGAPPQKTSAYLLPEVTPGSDTEAIVGAAANYSIYVEMGHHTRSGSYVPANPWFYPSVELSRRDMEQKMGMIILVHFELAV
jgi:phage gpG-like protein